MSFSQYKSNHLRREEKLLRRELLSYKNKQTEKTYLVEELLFHYHCAPRGWCTERLEGPMEEAMRREAAEEWRRLD
ncbi:hypothetical protein JHK85_048646 [Glycine max]|nr:hypothetical protein JHK85_048646 [Glycine max]